MNQKAIIAAVTLFALIVAGMFVFAYLKNMEMNVEEPVIEPVTEEETPDVTPITRVDAKHFYRDGVHTVAGEINMPTPCDLLTTNAAVVGGGEGTPARAVLSLNVINNSGGMCAQVITPQRFKVSFRGDPDIQIEATLRGERILLNLIEAGADENPDDFELFIKG